MKRFRLSLCLLFLLPALAAGQDALLVKGEGVKTVVVVSKLPFTVEGPKGASWYVWLHPSAVKATDRGDSLEVTSAPKGELTVTLKAVTVDFKGQKVIPFTASVTVQVGDAPKPPPGPDPQPPDPEPDPADPFAKAVRAAYLAEASSSKAMDAAALATVYRHGEAVAPTSATAGQLFKAMAEKAQQSGAAGKLPKVQAAIQAENLRILPTEMDAAIAVAERQLIAGHLGRVAAVLEGVAR